MNENYQEVPNILSCKDLDYLSDMFNWNYGAYKTAHNSANTVTDQELKGILETASNVFYDTMTKVLSILEQGGNNE